MRPLSLSVLPFSLLILLSLLLPNIDCLFEDQAFKFDWRSSLIGSPTSALFQDDDSSIIFVSESGGDGKDLVSVLSSVDSETGKLRWRHAMESGDLVIDVAPSSTKSSSILTLSRTSAVPNAAYVRVWNPRSGVLSDEGILVLEDGSSVSEHSFLSAGEANLVSFDQGRIVVRVFDLKKKEEVRSATLSTGSTSQSIYCAHTASAFLCFCPQMQTLYTTALPLNSKSAFSATPLSKLMSGDGKGLQLSTVSKDTARISMANGGGILLLKIAADGKIATSHLVKGAQEGKTTRSVSSVAGCQNSKDVLHLQQTCVDEMCNAVTPSIRVTRLRDLSSTVSSVELHQDADLVRNSWALCDQDGSFSLVTLGVDECIASMDSKDTAAPVWKREESLADIRKVELVSIGIKDDDGTYDSEGSSSIQDVGRNRNAGDSSSSEAMNLLQQFAKRIKHHFSLMRSAIAHLVEIRDLQQLVIGEPDANFDEFGLRKVIVAMTGHGTAVGMDSITGSIVWKLRFPGDDEGEKYLFVQRSALHFGHEAKCTLIYTNRNSHLPEMVTFNPLTGIVQEARQGVHPGLSKAILLHHTDEDHVRPILFQYREKDDWKVEIKPKSASVLQSISGKTFVVTTDKETLTVQGQRLLVNENGEISLAPVWTLANPSTDWVTVTAKSSEEKVHSQGRVMADRSVLFKYVNPNLGLLMAEGRDSTGKTYINVYLADLVTGRVVFSANHKRVNGPYHVVHSENWAVYTYFNEKARRAELTSIELFEGFDQSSNSSVFSSLSDSVMPLVERQSFILGSSYISALRDTVTEKSITSKNILVATATGALFNVPRHFVDPRRPSIAVPPEQREPGLPPYIPELQLPQELILNYNQTVAAPRGIATGATGLESTTVVFVYGLDLYCTRIAPSKAFDLLKDDFDYYVISVVLLALIAASYLTKRLSQRKSLKQAWR